MGTTSHTPAATRRGLLQGGIGLGALGGAMALGGLSAQAAPASSAAAALLPSAATINVGGIFLLLDGVTGDSLDARHQSWMDIGDFTFEAAAPTTVTKTGLAAGRPTVTPLQVQVFEGKASPKLFGDMLRGVLHPTATLDVFKAGADPLLLLQVKLSNVFLTEFTAAGSTGGDSFHKVTLAYTRISYAYYPQKPDGTLDTPIVATWDLALNAPF